MTKKTESLTPILDDEKNHSDFKVVRQLWLQRQPEWDALSQDSRRMQIETYNNTIEALDNMMHVMYDLERPIPDSIRKIACKEFEW